MAAITVRNLSDETHRALRQRASANGRSTEAEVRAILDDAALPAGRLKVGTALVDAFRKFGGVDLDIKRDPAPSKPIDFG